MKADTASPTNAGFDYAFIAFVFTLLGWALLESWLWNVGASLRVQVIFALPGIYLAALSAYQYRRWHKSVGQNYPARGAGVPGFTINDMGWAVLLFGAGSILGIFILAGSTFLLSVIAACMLFVPWSRAPFYRRRMAASSVIACLGAASVIAVGHYAIRPMSLPLSSWVLWSCACAAVLLQVNQARRRQQGTVENAPDTTASQYNAGRQDVTD